MSPFADALTLFADVPPYVGTAAVLTAAAIVTLLVGLVRAGRGVLRCLPGIVFIAAGAAVLWTQWIPELHPWMRTAVMTAAAALLTHVALGDTAGVELRPVSRRAPRVYLALTLGVASALLLYHLGTYAGRLLIWEAPVVAGYPDTGGFTSPLERGESVLHYTAERFAWDDGVLSAGQTSLFYGAPAYALFHVAGVSMWTLRFPSVVATLLSILVIYALVRRFFDPVTACAAAMAFGLSSCVLFYGRYGSSPAGTLLAVLLALWATWVFLDRDRSAWWMGGVCAVAFYLATLQYAPARIVVLTLLSFIGLTVAYQWRRLWWQRAVGCAVIAAVAVSAWHLQSGGAQRALLLARGEQYFDFIQHPEAITELFGRPLLNRPLRSDTLTLADKLEVAYRVVQATLPQYVSLMSPIIQKGPFSDDGVNGDLPQPYYAPLFLFVVWGLVYSVSRLGSPPHLCLLLWLAGGTVPLLLTNRVDCHRVVLFLVPLSLWMAFGLAEAARVLRRACVPAPVQHLFAALLALTVVYSDVRMLHRAPLAPSNGYQAITEAAAEVAGPVAVGAVLDHRDLAVVQLAMLERTRRDPTRPGQVLSEGLSHALAEGGTEPPEIRLRELQRIIKTTTVILAPATRFQVVAASLQRRGVRVAERGPSLAQVLRFDAGAEATGVPDDELKPLPAIVIPPTPTPIPLMHGPQISLTDLKPVDTTFGFAPPQIDRTWGGAPIMMGGVRYEHGIGTHAWCRMTYTVPPNATAFQAIAGLSDEAVRECGNAAVTFEVRDEKDAVLYDSGLVDATTPLMPLHVDLHGTTAITLVVTEGGNGRDCDHANWALPAFLLTTE